MGNIAIIKLKDAVEAISAIKELPPYLNQHNLVQIKQNLEDALRYLEQPSQKKPSLEGLGKHIVDEWPFNEQLGRLILDAVQEFKKV